METLFFNLISYQRKLLFPEKSLIFSLPENKINYLVNNKC